MGLVEAGQTPMGVAWRVGRQGLPQSGPVAPLCKIFEQRVITFNLTFREDFDTARTLRCAHVSPIVFLESGSFQPDRLT
jgi:hypothetical protein